MKETITWIVLIALVAFSGYLFMRLQALENIATTYKSKMPVYDQVVEVVEDCMEFNTLGECKQRYPQYAEQFR